LINVELNMMNRKALYLIALPLVFTACKTKCVEDLGIHAVRSTTVKPYDEIKLSGPIKLILRQDSSFGVNVEADSSVIALVKTDVSGHELTVKLDDGKYCGKDSIIVSAGIGDLKKLTSSGAAKVYTSSAIHVNQLDLKLDGASKVNMDLVAGKLITSTEGSAQINLSGQAGSHTLKSKGTIELNAFSFITGVYDLNIDGVGKLKVNVLNDLNIKTSGAAEIQYKGSPKNIKEKQSGTYKLEKVN